MTKKSMWQKTYYLTGIFLTAVLYSSCATSGTAQKSAMVMDLVCGMKVMVSEAYKFQYKDKKYYFDSYNCKESFKMNPEKFLTNNCIAK